MGVKGGGGEVAGGDGWMGKDQAWELIQKNGKKNLRGKSVLLPRKFAFSRTIPMPEGQRESINPLAN